MVEFAMVLPIALTLMFAIIQAGGALYAYNFVAYAARSGARYATVHGANSASPATAASVSSYVSGLAVALNTAQLTTTTTWLPNNNPGSLVSVDVSYIYKPLAPFIWSANLTLDSHTETTISN